MVGGGIVVEGGIVVALTALGAMSCHSNPLQQTEVATRLAGWHTPGEIWLYRQSCYKTRYKRKAVHCGHSPFKFPLTAHRVSHMNVRF